ncbi:MAG TPA: LD-carboxypeptidase, partial [Thermoanaerobaculia bacterium]|nr:LD-carboxypeptidase [Thermoanaerobaculia bacterium]
MNRRLFTQLSSFALLGLASGARAVTPKTSRVIKPKRLEEGDTVGMVLPASNTMHADSIDWAREQLEALGFQVKLGRHVYDRHGYFAGADRDRAADLNRMFADPDVDGIFCYTGGWGTPRILPLLDYALIARNPKVLIGFSDITALLNAIYQRTGLITFHGPVAGSTLNPYSVENFRRVVMEEDAAGVLAPPEKRPNELVDRTNRILHLAPGKGTGRIVGGNLSLIAATMGTPFEIETEGNILILEDIDEGVYRIDRMLTQLALAGKFDRAAGVVFGRCTDCADRNSGFSLEDVLRDRFGKLPVPAISGLSFGHIENKLTLPIGGLATLDADEGTLALIEPA